jgi:PAS domain S-box-containing protein
VSVIMPTIKSIRAMLASGHQDRTGSTEEAGRHTDQSDCVVSLHGHQTKAREQTQRDDARFWLAAIADSSDDAIVGTNLGGVVTSWNKAAEATYGYAANEIIGQMVDCIIPMNRVDEEPSILKRIRRGEKIVHFETKRQRKDGTVIPVSLTVQAIRDDQGRIIGASKTTRDLTETQRTQREQGRRETLLRSILDSVPDALIVIDKQGAIHSFSAAAMRLFGYTSEEMMGRHVSAVLPSSDWEQNNNSLAGYSATGERHTFGLGQRKDSSSFPMELVIGEVTAPGTRLFTVFVRDLTAQAAREREMRAANAELERFARQLAMARDVADRSNWAKSRFLAGMGHELRAPLSGILGYAELLHVEGGLSGAQSARVDAMLGAGKHLLKMVTDVLDLSGIKAELVELQAVELDALAVARACLDVFRSAAEAKHLALSIAVAPRTRQLVVTDPDRLRQVLLNLLGNAVRYTSQGSIEIRLRPIANGSVLRIEVADTGPGIPANDRRRLFREFERLDIEATGTTEGDGLGLALSARLVALLGGCLGHHDNPGGGSVFWLELPLDTAAVSSPIVPLAGGVPATPPIVLDVLVVDDVAMNRDIAECFLRAAGHNVTCAGGGVEAIAAVEATDFDVVLMDVRMPGMDGLEATRRIRSLGGDRGRVPIVALTAQAFTDQLAECRAAGMDGHLSKPFDPDTLVATTLRACAARLTFGKGLVPISTIAGNTVIGSELAVCNPSAFERTAFYLAPEAVGSYLDAIAERGEALLRALHGPDALLNAGDQLAEAAHTIAGSAGMFGFERLTTMGRRFEQAIQAGAPNAPALADGLTAALVMTLQAIHDRTLVVLEG